MVGLAVGEPGEDYFGFPACQAMHGAKHVIDEDWEKRLAVIIAREGAFGSPVYPRPGIVDGAAAASAWWGR